MPAPARIFQTGRAAALSLALLLAGAVSAQDPPAVARPLEDLLSYADLLFSKDQFAIAAQQYQTFIRENPDSPGLQSAWFRLGECYLKVKQTEDAVTTFNYLVNHYKKGPFVGAAAYRLAVLRFNGKDYRNALAYFKLAKDELSEPTAKLQAQFYYARSLQLTGQAKEALANFEAVMAAAPGAENPFNERCLLETARLLFETGAVAKSLERFQVLAESATTPEFKEEAIVRGALMAAEAGQTEVSEALLAKALKFPDESPWKSLAQVGAIFNAFSRGDHDRVIALYNTGSYLGGNAAQDESRPKLLLVVGHSFRIKGDLESAVRLYTLVEGKFPDRPEGSEAGYRKLQLLHQQGDPGLPAAVREFVARQQKIDPQNSYIDMAWLMVGEWHFTQAENSASGPGSDFAKKHYGDAAAAYREVRPANIDRKYHEARLYKQGWAEIESGDPDAGILTLARFIQQHSQSALASSALAKRAIAYQAKGDHQFALGDYLDIAKRYPDSAELEFAMQQTALIYAHLRKIPEMIEAYQNLLAKFPKTEGAGEAHYWIGIGYFDTERFTEALESLDSARTLDPSLEDKATLRLVIARYQLENLPELAVEARRYLENAPAETAAAAPVAKPVEAADDSDDDSDEDSKDASAADDESARSEELAAAEPAAEAPAKRARIPTQILEFLGSHFAEASNWKEAEFFLSAVATPNNPEKTSATVWRLLGDACAALKRHAEAVRSYDHYLLQTERPSDRASAYLARGAAQLCLRDFDGARSSAQESLRSQKEGRTNAEARILLGDVSAAQGDLAEAAKSYLVVSKIFMDPEITPKALAKAIQAYRSLGDQEKAQELAQELSATYPDYEASASTEKEC